MSTLTEWQNYIQQQIAARIEAIFPIQAGSVIESNAGWYHVPFAKPFSSTPYVVATQSERTNTPSTQKLTPPSIPAPSVSVRGISPPSLASVKIPPPSNPYTWGSAAQKAVSGACNVILGNSVPWPLTYVTGYLCTILGNAAAWIANAAQIAYYAASGDWSQLATIIESAVEDKIAADWNNFIDSNMQPLINGMYADFNYLIETLAGDVNTGLADLTTLEQDIVNGIYDLVNAAIGLESGLSIPTAQVRNISIYGFDVYSPGQDVAVNWVAVLA